MIPVMCIVQERQVSTEAERELKAQISRFTQRTFAAPADIDWIVVPIGSGFTAAEPPNAMIASLYANRPLQQDERVRLLKELADICIANTGRSAQEVTASIRDPQEA